jgi:hypothetical protein
MLMLMLILVSHFFLAADTGRIVVVLLSLLQAIVQGYPTLVVQRRNPSMLSPSACMQHAHGAREAGGPS